MQDRHKKRNKEYCQNLAVNRSFDFFLTHSYFLHNLIPVFVIIAFRNLFVINDQDRRHQEQESYKNSKEEKSAVNAIKFLCISFSVFYIA